MFKVNSCLLLPLLLLRAGRFEMPARTAWHPSVRDGLTTRQETCSATTTVGSLLLHLDECMNA
jgi:hypothetical protein